MRAFCWFGAGLAAGLLPAFAQQPRIWHDPDQGCTYVVDPQAGIGLRYRSDGSPDCRNVPAGRTTAAPAPSATSGVAPHRSAQLYSCRAEGQTANGAPAAVQVHVDPGAKAIVVQSEKRGPQRYSLDTDWSNWFNGRNERDPRLGIVLAPAQGRMWLDVAAPSGGPHHDIRSQQFACDADVAHTASTR